MNEQERARIEYDVLVVGAGPAGLACAIRLKQLNDALEVCVIEKGSQVGSHILSGAVIEPAALDELLGDWRDDPPPVCVPAEADRFDYLTRKRRLRLPTPPQMRNRGNLIVSLGALCAWLAPRAEALGVEIFPGFAATEPLVEEDRVAGVRIGDKGVDRDGNPKEGYSEGIDIAARATVLAEGCRGHLTKQLIERFELDRDCDPQTYGIGFKELWQCQPGRVQPGLVQHTVGWPLDGATYGGSFVYHMNDDRLAVGFVAGLDYEDPDFRPFEAFQQFKHHPSVKPLLEGGEILSSGSRALVEGGWQSLPKIEMPGAVIIGDAAGTLNVPKIKGTHQAVRSGMLAAEHLNEHVSAEGFDARLRNSIVMKELWKVRNIRPGFQRGFGLGMANAAWETLTAGLSPWTLRNRADWKATHRRGEYAPPERHWVERDLPPKDRLASVYYAATDHDENQPVHLQVLDTSICIDRCTREYGNPCERFCPAHVYEMVEDDSGRRLQINASNCVHCKTCDIKDPYEIINWVTPEGGAGPNYQSL